jgi:hypothetical protein
MTKDYLDSFLEKKEQEKLEQFANDELMFQAVRKVLLFSIYNSGTITKGKPHDPLHNFALVAAADNSLNDEKLGKLVRSSYQGINALELGFNDLTRYKSIPMPESLKNPAR